MNMLLLLLLLLIIIIIQSISEISQCFFGPRLWHIEIRHRVTKTSTMNLFGFETLKLTIRRLKLWKPTVLMCHGPQRATAMAVMRRDVTEHIATLCHIVELSLIVGSTAYDISCCICEVSVERQPSVQHFLTLAYMHIVQTPCMYSFISTRLLLPYTLTSISSSMRICYVTR